MTIIKDPSNCRTIVKLTMQFLNNPLKVSVKVFVSNSNPLFSDVGTGGAASRREDAEGHKPAVVVFL